MSRVSFDDPRRQQRLNGAAERAQGRSGANDDKTIAGAGQTVVVLGVVLGGFLSALGSAMVLMGLAPVGLAVMVLGVTAAIGGVLAGRRAGGLRLPGVDATASSPASAPQLNAAFERARDSIDGSPGIEETQKVEIVAALRAALDETLAVEAGRDGLMAALNNLPDDASAAGQRLRDALADLDRRRAGFLDQCARLQAGVATLAIGSDKGSALAELSAAAADLGGHADAERELADALAVPRPTRRPERG